MKRLFREQLAPEWVGLAADEGGPASGCTEAHLAKINALPGVLKPLTAAEVYVRGVRLVNDRPFKDGKRQIETAAIGQIARLLPGTPVMVNHETFGPRALPVGRTFDAYVERDADGTSWAVALAYFLRASGPIIDTAAFVAAIDGGTIAEASIGMFPGTFRCSNCRKEVPCGDHVPGKSYGGIQCLWQYGEIEAVDEWSAVYSGAVEGTRYFLAASGDSEQVDADAMEAEAVARAERGPIRTYFEQPGVDPWARYREAFKQT